MQKHFLLETAFLLRSSSVWQGQLWPKGSGAEGKPIRVSMYGGGVKPVINGDGLFEDAVLLKNQEYWEIEDLEITNTGAQRAERVGFMWRWKITARRTISIFSR